MGFRAAVVVGDMASHVGLGLGKASEVAAAIRKGVAAAKKNIIEVIQVEGTIPHQIIGEFSASQVVLRPAPPGTGVIAGGAVRTILELAGVKIDFITSKTGFGGERLWFSCPVCSRRVGVVYQDRGMVACRHCLNIKYRKSRFKGMVENLSLKALL